MFELERALQQWLSASVPAGCRREQHVDELNDHLREEIATLRRRGLDEEAAFHAAVQRLGDAASLAAELRRSRGRLAWWTAATPPTEESAMDERRLQKRVAALVLVQSAAWAAVMMAASRTLADSGLHDQITPWLLAGWFVTTFMPLTLLDLRSSARAEWQCLRRWVRR